MISAGTRRPLPAFHGGMMAAPVAPRNSDLESRSGILQVAAASLIGTSIEWYDFFLYGTAAALVFNKLFFPTFAPLAGTIAAFATYAVGFIARPIGGIVFGHYGDELGRKTMLYLTLLIMGLATTAIGLLPTYATIGIWAPILLVAMRLLQGLGIGGEWGGAVLMAIEHAPAHRRGFYGSWPQMGVAIGLLLSTLVFRHFSGYPEDEREPDRRRPSGLEQPEEREREDATGHRTPQVDRSPAEAVREGAPRRHGEEATCRGHEQAVQGHVPVQLELGRDIGERERGKNVEQAVFGESRARSEEHGLHVPAEHLDHRHPRLALTAFQPCEHRRLGQAVVNPQPDGEEDEAQEERHPPPPRQERRLRVARDVAEHERREQQADRHTHLRPAPVKAAAVRGRTLDRQQHGPAPF